MIDLLQRITNADYLHNNLSFVSLYIAVYEHVVDYVVSNVKSLLCDVCVENGEVVCHISDQYKIQILKRIVDEHGNKNDPTRASFLWLVDNDAITKSEYELFLNIKGIRNKYAHELMDVICQGTEESEQELFVALLTLYKKIASWFYMNVEAPIMGYSLPSASEQIDVHTGTNFILNVILEVLYNGKADEYQKILNDLT